MKNHQHRTNPSVQFKHKHKIDRYSCTANEKKTNGWGHFYFVDGRREIAVIVIHRLDFLLCGEKRFGAQKEADSCVVFLVCHPNAHFLDWLCRAIAPIPGHIIQRKAKTDQNILEEKKM